MEKLIIEWHHVDEANLPKLAAEVATTDKVELIGGLAVIKTGEETEDKVVGAISVGRGLVDYHLLEIRGARILNEHCSCRKESFCSSCSEIATFALDAIKNTALITHNGIFAPHPEGLAPVIRHELEAALV